MAKKNSSKTATEKSLQASEPRVQVFSGWQGINIKDAPLGWNPLESSHFDHRQTDLKPNYLMLQNNMVTDDSGTVQTRPDARRIAVAPSGWKFTGVSFVHDRWLFCVCRSASKAPFIERIFWNELPEEGSQITSWNQVPLYDAESGVDPAGYEIGEIGVYEQVLIATTRHKQDGGNAWVGEIFTASFTEAFETTATYEDGIKRSPKSLSIGQLSSAIRVNDPNVAPVLEAVGMQSSDHWEQNMVSRTEVTYVYVNRFGTTMPSPISTIYTDSDPVTWSSAKYLRIKGTAPSNQGIVGVDVYASTDDKQTKAFIGHVNTTGGDWSITWLGAMDDIADWANSSLELPEENTTKGVPAAHFAAHDSRLYFWGNLNEPYRLYIGGNPGNELSVARGLGGAFVDIEPGTGIEIKGTAKWKTTSGANIVTMMCGNPNTNMVKRFNLVETNLVTTNEVSSKGYMYEEVSNVIGCNSRWGYGVYDDGLYSISRYGLMLTTMAMEYNSQMKNQQISEVIQPVFTDRMGDQLKDCRMVCIDSIIYIVLRQPDSDELDQVILVYDIGLKSWYTFTHDQVPKAGQAAEKIRHIMAIDSDERAEGLGVITDQQVWLYPTAGHVQDEVKPVFNVLLETGEMMVRQPLQQHHWVQLIELRFDYFIGNGLAIVEGVDYYGRPFKVEKILNIDNNQRNMREYIEWIQIGKLVESYRIRIIGQMRCRLVSMNVKLYTHANRIGTAYGYDDWNSYRNRHGEISNDHHYIKDYNNLRRAIVT